MWNVLWIKLCFFISAKKLLIWWLIESVGTFERWQVSCTHRQARARDQQGLFVISNVTAIKVWLVWSVLQLCSAVLTFLFLSLFSSLSLSHLPLSPTLALHLSRSSVWDLSRRLRCLHALEKNTIWWTCLQQVPKQRHRCVHWQLHPFRWDCG